MQGKDYIFSLGRLTLCPNAIFLLSELELITQRECILTQVMETRATKGRDF